MKPIVTVLLVVSLLFMAPQPTAHAQPKPKLVAIACGVLIVGGVIVWGLWKICKKIPCPNPPSSDNPPAPPPTNAPPATNPPPSRASQSYAKSRAAAPPQARVSLGELDSGGIQPYDISSYSYPDTVAGKGATYVTKSMFTLESSTNLVNWQPVWNVSVFDSSSGGELWSVSRGGSNIFNAYYTNPQATNNCLPIDFDDGKSPNKSFRLVSLAW